ncbi:MAG: MFS transporter [Candidatus Eremiobacterota bacterium]
MKQLSLLADRRFWPLFWTQFLGAFNDNFLKNALIVLITYQEMRLMGLHHTAMAVFAGGLFILPFFVFSATAGQLADRYDKAWLIRIIKLVEVGLMLLATVGFVLVRRTPHGQAGIWVLLLALALMGVHATFFGPLKYGILPQLLGREDRLVGGNALVEMGTQVAILLGTLVGGILAARPPDGPIYVSLGLVAASLAGYLASRRVPDAPAGAPELRVRWNPVPPTLEILRFVHPQRAIFLSILGNSWFWLYGAAFLHLIPSYTRDSLGAAPAVFTLFMATFCIGVAVGSVLCEKVSFDRLELGLVPFGSIGMTLFGIDLFLASPAAPPGHLVTLQAFLGSWPGRRILADLFLLALSSGLFIVPLYTLLQQRSAPSHRSRVIAANNIVNAIFIVASTVVIMGFLQAGLTIPAIFLILALMNAAVAVYIYTLLPEFFLRFCVYLAAHVAYRLRTRGLENIPREGPAVLVCNHVSFVDWLLIAADIHRPVRFVMDLTYARLPLLRAIFRDAKVIPIASAKRDPKVLEEAFERISEELQAGELVCIFPEGRVTDDGNMSEFRPGVERIVARDPVPVIPMALQGLWGSFFSRKHGGRAFRRIRGFRSRIQLVIGPAVPADQVTAEFLQERVGALLEGPRA